jgi:hypothetical protein
MQPFAENTVMHHVETTQGTSIVPAEFCSNPPTLEEMQQYCEGTILLVDGEPDYQRQEGWYARFSAPGYMDCTDYIGPYKTAELAFDALAETHECCRHCWEQCWDSDEGDCQKREEKDDE